MGEKSNFTFSAAVVEMRPIIFVEEGKIKIGIKELRSILDLMPKNMFLTAVTTPNFDIGLPNKTGHYDGLLGIVQQGKADFVLYPIPIDILKPPGEFIDAILFESGTQILSLSRMDASKKQNDLIDGVLIFDLPSIFFLLSIYLIISYLIYKLFDKQNKFHGSLFLVYRIMLKEHNISLTKGRSLLSFILIYHLMLLFMVETNVNTQLVVTSREKPIDSVEDLWADVQRKPTFMKGHFSNNHFMKTHDKKAEAIYERAKKCDCIRDSKNLLTAGHSKLKGNEVDSNWAIVCEQQIITAAKKMMCNRASSYILELGSLHSSPLMFKTLFSILRRFGMHKRLKKYLEIMIVRGFECGLALNAVNNVKMSNYGYIKNMENEYKECIALNFPKSIQDSDYRIKFANTIILISFYLALNASTSSLFILSWLLSSMFKRK